MGGIWGILGSLTVDEEGDLPLAHADPGDDGLAHVLAGVCLSDRLEVQLVAVAQHLRGVGWGQLGTSRKGHRNPPKRSGARP